jgi:hypothetical protein
MAQKEVTLTTRVCPPLVSKLSKCQGSDETVPLGSSTPASTSEWKTSKWPPRAGQHNHHNRGPCARGR